MRHNEEIRMGTFRLPDVVRKQVVDFISLSQTVGYQISMYHIPDYWAVTKGEGVKVAILDTGCDVSHVDLSGGIYTSYKVNCVVPYSLRKSYKKEKNLSKKKRLRRRINAYCTAVNDVDGHGTHVAGIIGARNNAVGIVGVAPDCSLIPIKVLGDDGTGDFNSIVSGINKAIELGVDVINMSLGSPAGSPALADAVKRAYRAGIAVICAAGNSGTQSLDFPARYPQTISVGAIDKNNLRASFSQMGSTLDFVAPGVDILSTYPGNRYMVMSGTSMATPWVVGAVALLISKHRKSGGKTPINNVEDIRTHLRRTCIDLNSSGPDIQTGFGLIDVSKLMAEEASILSNQEYVEVLKARIAKLENALYNPT